MMKIKKQKVQKSVSYKENLKFEIIKNAYNQLEQMENENT